MEFTEFAQKIKPVIGGADSTSLFARKLFDEITTEEADSLIEEVKDDTFKAYFNGRTGITQISKKILPYIEPENFSTYLEVFSDATIQNLCDIFKSDIIGIDSLNASEEIAYFFRDILVTAASKKRKSTPKSANETNLINIIEEHPTDTYPFNSEDWELLQEFNLDFDEITILLAGENLGTILLEKTLLNTLTNLYESKWKDKASEFTNPTLKSYIFALLGEFHSLSTLSSSEDRKPYEIKNTQTKIQKLYIKLHPNRFDIAYPYGAFIDDWDDI